MNGPSINSSFLRALRQGTRKNTPLMDDAGAAYDVFRLTLPKEALESALFSIFMGLDYNIKDERGLTIVGAIHKRVEDVEQRNQLLEAMIEEVNPFQLSDADFNLMFNSLASRAALEVKIAEQESLGRTLSNEEGGNLYHCIARLNLWRIPDFIRGLQVGRMESIELFRETRLRWLKAANDMGDTPLHVLWQDETLARELAANKNANNAIITAQINFYCAIGTNLMMDMGADILLPNKAGVTPWDLMSKRDFSKVDEDDEAEPAIAQVFAKVEQLLLARATPAAPARNKGSLRL